MPKTELRVDKNKPLEGQVCEILGSTDRAEITKVAWLDGKPILAFRLMEEPDDDAH